MAMFVKFDNLLQIPKNTIWPQHTGYKHETFYSKLQITFFDHAWWHVIAKGMSSTKVAQYGFFYWWLLEFKVMIMMTL